MSQDKPGLSRRRFLFAVGAGGAASAAAIVSTGVAPPPAADANDKRKTKGYYASEHIRNYYKTTKV
jgi:hypothetical protein